MDYSLQANKKSREGTKEYPFSPAQFRYIETKTKTFQQQHQPVLSVDTKKKENVGTRRMLGKNIVKRAIRER